MRNAKEKLKALRGKVRSCVRVVGNCGEWPRIVCKRKTVGLEFACVVIGALLALVSRPSEFFFALTSGGAASAFIALLIDMRAVLEQREEERQKILNFDEMILPLIRRWVELYIYMSDKNLVRSSALANTVGSSKRCGVDLMPGAFQLDDMINMFNHPYLAHFPLNVPVVELFVENNEKLEHAIELFLNCNSLSNFEGVKRELLKFVNTKRLFDVSRHVLEDKVTTLGGVTFWNNFKTMAGALVTQFPPYGKGNPIYSHYFAFMQLLKAERRILQCYRDEIDALSEIAR